MGLKVDTCATRSKGLAELQQQQCYLGQLSKYFHVRLLALPVVPRSGQMFREGFTILLECPNKLQH